jgi:hypothetical protein
MCLPDVRRDNFTFNVNSTNVRGTRVRTAVTMKITVFWIVTPCSLVAFYRRLVDLLPPHLDDSDADGVIAARSRKG